MQNVNLSTKGNHLTIGIDLAHEIGASSTGKSIIVANHEGDCKVAVNGTLYTVQVVVFKPHPDYKKKR